MSTTRRSGLAARIVMDEAGEVWRAEVEVTTDDYTMMIADYRVLLVPADDVAPSTDTKN